MRNLRIAACKKKNEKKAGRNTEVAVMRNTCLLAKCER
jgi:hypothetical protein